MSLPVVMTAAGAQPQSPQSLNSQLISAAIAADPGLTANLPGTLIEDILSTDTQALVLIDQAQVETINSLTPYGANLFILGQLGNIYGVTQGVSTNTSVYCVFSGTPGYVVPKGLIVSDGTYQYQVQDVGIISASGFSLPIYCVATIEGSWAVPANSVTTIASSVPAGITVTVTNPNSGIPSTGVESNETYRSRVVQAGLAAATGMPAMIKTLVRNLGVSLVSIVQNGYYNPAKWEVIANTGDPYQIAGAIYQSVGDPNILCGSTCLVTGITVAADGVVSTNLYHGYTSSTFSGSISGFTLTVSSLYGGSIALGDAVVGTCPSGTVITAFLTGTGGAGTYTVSNSGTYTATSSGTTVTITGITGTMGGALNGVPFVAQNTTNQTFHTGISTTGLTWASGGICTPNTRTQNISVYDDPDTYQIPVVIALLQNVVVHVVWNTIAANIISNASVAQLGTPVLDAYINAIGIGQPMNTFEMTTILSEALTPIIPANQLTRLVYTVYIDGEQVPPEAGTGAIYGDPEGYFNAQSITMAQG